MEQPGATSLIRTILQGVVGRQWGHDGGAGEGRVTAGQCFVLQYNIAPLLGWYGSQVKI